MDFSKIKNIYLIGIKGVGMTMLAEYLAGQGFFISGSDTAEVFMTDAVLKRAGIKVTAGFKTDNIPAEADLIIYSTAYDDRNPELAAAKMSGKKVITYAEALATVFNQAFGIAVAGSHGKTTTTAWLGFVLNQAGLKPSVLVGAAVPQFGGAALIGTGNLLVAEADEYQNKLAALKPKMVLLNNIDYDHPDFYPTEVEYFQAFADFTAKLGAKDTLIANFDDEQIKSLSATTEAKVLSYALNNSAEFKAEYINYQKGRQYFKVKMGEEDLGDFSIQLLGRHNISNALAVIAASLELGADLLAVRTALGEFTGTSRRLEKMGEYNGALIYDDYAHHPTEIKATIEAIKQLYPDKALTVVFHPHTFSRTAALLDDLAASFAGVDRLLVLEIYASAREQAQAISSLDLLKTIAKVNPDLKTDYAPDLAAAENYLRANLKPGELVVLMGAGDVFRVGERLIKKT